MGPALWAEIGGGDCPGFNRTVDCASGSSRLFLGGFGSFDLDLLHWLRLGATVGLGFNGSESQPPGSSVRTTQRHWFVPIGAHMYWRVELGKRLTLWGGPELGLGLFVNQRRSLAPAQPAETMRRVRTGFLAGLAVGLDVRLAGAFRLGLEVGESVLIAEGDDGLDLRAMTRFALALRYL